ncbi:MAG: tetratricopeptide repeat protein [Planctomycetota bacterium]
MNSYQQFLEYLIRKNYILEEKIPLVLEALSDFASEEKKNILAEISSKKSNFSSELTPTKSITEENFLHSEIKPFPVEHQRYILLETLGEGGMGIVERVQDTLLEREVALKRIKDQNPLILTKAQKIKLWRFQKEARLTAVLEHPNIIPLYDMERKDTGELLFTMRKVEGKTLKNLLEAMKLGSQDYDENRLLSIFFKICDAVSYAHSKNIVHRDLKPENIMIGAFGEVYVMDWGIAKRLTTSSDSEEEDISFILNPTPETNSRPLTQQPIKIATEEKIENHPTEDEFKTIGGIGTPGYMPPEQSKNASQVNTKADIFTLGKILRQCFIYLSPYEEFLMSMTKASPLDSPQTSLEIQNSQIFYKNLIEKIPPDIDAIIDKATQSNPEDRYNSVPTMVQDIENYLKNRRVSVRNYSTIELLKKWSQRNKKRLALLSAVFFLLVLGWSYTKFQIEQAVWKQSEKAIVLKRLRENVNEKGKNGREKKIAYLLEEINVLNESLIYKPGNQESEIAKMEAAKELFPLCYEEQDYQLASFIASDIQALINISKSEKIEFKEAVQKAKSRNLTQHLKTLNAGYKKYHTEKKQPSENILMQQIENLTNWMDTQSGVSNQEQLQIEERSEFVFEVSQMQEEEILEQLLLWLEDGKTAFIERKPLRDLEKVFYEDIAQIVGKQGNTRANERLRKILKDLYAEIELWIGDVSESELQNLEAGNLIGSLQDKIQELLSKSKKTLETVTLRKIETYQWEVFPANLNIKDSVGLLISSDVNKGNVLKASEALYGIQVYPQGGKNRLRIYDIKRNKDTDYIQMMCAMMKALCALQDAPSLELLLTIQYTPDNNPLFQKNLQFAFKKVIALFPKQMDLSSEGYYYRGLIKHSEANYEGALFDYTESIRLNPKNVEAYLNRGLSKFEQKKYDEALADYEKALELNPQSAKAYYHRGVLKARKKEWEGADLDYTKALELKPHYSEAYQSRGFKKESNGDFEGALKDYNESIRLNPHHLDIYMCRAALKKAQKDWNGAIQDFTEVLKRDPQNIFAYHDRGLVKEELQDYDGAIQDYTEVLKINPYLAEAYINRGNSKQSLKDLDGAIADYTEVIRLYPKNPSAYYSRAISKQLQGDLEGSIQDSTEAIRLDPKFSLAYNSRGLVRQDHGDIEGAIQDLTEAIRLSPKNASGYNNRGLAKLKKKEFSNAVQDFDEAIRLESKNFGYHFNRGLAKTDPTEALIDFSEALRLNPNIPEIYFHLGIAYVRIHEPSKAILYWEKGLSLRKDSKIEEMLIKAFVSQGKTQKEKKEYANAIDSLSRLKKYLSPQDSRLPKIEQEIKKLQELQEKK